MWTHVIIGDRSEGRFLTLSEASPLHCRCFAEQLGNIGDGSPNHRRYYHIEYASPMFARPSPMCRRCVWDIFGLGVHRRMFADCSTLFGDISVENFNACIEFFIDVQLPSRCMAITRVRRRSFAEPLVLGGAVLAMPKCVHRERRLKKPRGTVALKW